jgi:hypothetical protein
MHLLISGDPLDGIEIHGPFANDDEAVEWADVNIDGKYWLVQPSAPAGDEKSAALMQIWNDAVDESDTTDQAGDIDDPQTGARDGEQRQLWYYNDMLAAFYRKDVQRNAVAPRGHHCESWQLQDRDQGGKYCGACGRQFPNA